MPIENMAEEGLAKLPDLDIAQWIFTCKINPVTLDLYSNAISIRPIPLPLSVGRYLIISI